MTYEIIRTEMVRTAEIYSTLIEKHPDQGHMLIGQREAELNGMIKIALNLPDVNPEDFRNLIALQNKITGLQ